MEKLSGGKTPRNGVESHDSTAQAQALDPARIGVEHFEHETGRMGDALAPPRHAAEKRAGHRLFGAIEWRSVVGQHRAPATGDWVRILHGVLRRKARCEAAAEAASLADTEDFVDEVRRFLKTSDRLAVPMAGNYV